MTGWKQSSKGLWVPEVSWPRGPRTVSINDFRSLFEKYKVDMKYLLARPRRDKVRGTEKAPETLDSWQPLDPERLKDHIMGRAEESVKVLVGIAVLRSLDWVKREPEVACRGAQYQTGQGSGPYEAAHRFPGDPTIDCWSVPHYSKSRVLAAELERPLRETDYLPKYVNLADKRFENSGGKNAVVEPIRFVLYEQKPGQPPDPVLLRHALLNMMLPAYKRAYRRALSPAEADKADGDLITPEAMEEIDQASGVALSDVDVSKPGSCPLIVRYALWFSAHLAAMAGEPVGASRFAIMRYARMLETKSKEN